MCFIFCTKLSKRLIKSNHLYFYSCRYSKGKMFLDPQFSYLIEFIVMTNRDFISFPVINSTIDVIATKPKKHDCSLLVRTSTKLQLLQLQLSFMIWHMRVILSLVYTLYQCICYM